MTEATAPAAKPLSQFEIASLEEGVSILRPDDMRRRLVATIRALQTQIERSDSNRLDLWAALNLVRQEVEEHGPVVAGEHLPDPTPQTEAQALVETIATIFSGKEAEVLVLREALENAKKELESIPEVELPGEIEDSINTACGYLEAALSSTAGAKGA